MKYVILGDDDEVIGGGECPETADISHLGKVQILPDGVTFKRYQQWWDGETLQDVPPAPTKFKSEFNWKRKKWETPKDVKEQIKLDVAKQVYKRGAAPISFKGTEFACTVQAQLAILFATLRYDSSVPVNWTWIDVKGDAIPFSGEEWKNFCGLIADRFINLQKDAAFMQDKTLTLENITSIDVASDEHWQISLNNNKEA